MKPPCNTRWTEENSFFPSNKMTVGKVGNVQTLQVPSVPPHLHTGPLPLPRAPRPFTATGHKGLFNFNFNESKLSKFKNQFLSHIFQVWNSPMCLKAFLRGMPTS